jgi:hypothetical protein
MNLFDIFEGAIDDLEARRIEDLNAKMDDLTARAKDTSDPKFKEALRHEFAKAKAERDSYYKINVDEAPGAETLSHNQATDASNLQALGLAEEEKLLDPEEYGLELPIATVRRIVTAVMAQVDPRAVVKVRSSPEGYYLVSTDNEMLTFDFGITADGGEISANIVNGYSSYKGAGVVTKIIEQCFKAMVKKYGKPTKFVISTQQDRGDGVWQAIAQKLGAEWGGSVMEASDRYDAQSEAKKAYNFIRDNWMDDIELRKYAGTTKSPQAFYQAVHDYRKKAREDNIVKSLARRFDSVYSGSNDSPWYAKESKLEETDTNYTYTVFIDGTKEGTYGSKEEAKAVVARKKQQAPDRDYTIKPKSRTSMTSIKRFQKNRDREIEEAANPAQQAAIAINMKKNHQTPKTEGAKVDRMQKHIASSEKELGHSKKDAEAIGWATLNKRGYLDNKNKKNHTNESLEKVPTEKLQALWNQHKDEQRPNPAFAQQLRLVAKELARRKDVDEASMDWASHKSTGPKFSGYLKGTDPAPTEYGNKSFGGCEEEEMEEGIDGNMTVRSSPLSQPLRKRNFVAKNAIQSGAGKHANQLKKAAAAGRHAKHKGQPLDLDEGDNFLTWAVRNGYNLNKPAVYESARNTYKALVEDCGPIAPHKTYYGAMDESLKKGEYYVWTVFFDDGSSKRIKVTSDEFDPYEYYAKQKKNVINVDYNWEIQQ